MDTEGFGGGISCICTPEQCIEPQTIDEVLWFLYKTKGVIYETFNLRYDVQAIFKLLPRENIIELGTNGLNKTEYKEYKISYIPKKRLTITKGKHSVHLFDLSQFFMGDSLNSAAKRYLGDSKNAEELNIDRVKIGNEPGYYESRRLPIMKYCKKDASLTRDLANFMANTFAKIQFPTVDEPPIAFNRPISVANVAEKWLLSRKQTYSKPRDWLNDNGMHEAARLSYGGGRFSTLKRGHFTSPLYDYDLNSAYPATMATLPHWDNGKFDILQFGSEVKIDDCDYTWLLCDFDCEHIRYDSTENWKFEEEIKIGDKWEPFAFHVQNSRIYYPTGARRAWLTGLDVDFLRRNNYPVKILYGVGWRETQHKLDNPFGWMPAFYEKRKEVKAGGDYAVQYAMKIFLNSLYGKTVSAKYGFAKMTNFFYGSYITSDCRCKVNQVYVDNSLSIVNIATDGLLSTSPIEGLDIGNKLGQWEYVKYKRGVVLGNGMRQLWYDEPKIDENGNEILFVTYARGLTDKKSWDMLAELQKNLDKDELTFVSYRPIQLGEILNFTKKFKFSDLNRFMERKRKLRVNADTTRVWEREFTCFRDMLESSPIDSKPKKVEDC